MLVAWSPIRSRCRETRIRSSAGSIVEWILQHVGEQLAEHLGLQRVQPIVAVEHRLREVEVAPHERVERVAQHRLRDVAILRDVDQRLDRRMLQIARAASAMFTARSPTRSRSVLILTAATIGRRSVAIG